MGVSGFVLSPIAASGNMFLDGIVRTLFVMPRR